MIAHGKDVKYAVIGGDERQIYAALDIADRGFEVALYGFDSFDGDVGLCTRCDKIQDAVRKASVVLLPLTVSNDNEYLNMPLSTQTLSISTLANVIDKNAVVFGGKSEVLSDTYGVKVIDYLERDEFVIANAYLTAESAVGIAMSETKSSLRDTDVLVMGYGRIGKSLCSILKGMGVNVYASARKNSDFSWIRAYGYSPVDTSKVCEVVSSCKLVLNTIPELVLGKGTLGCMHKDTLIIDLASKPGGVDFNAAKECGIKTIWALALPGKKLPVSAGKIMARTVIDTLEDMEVI